MGVQYVPTVPAWYPTGPVTAEMHARAAARQLLAAHDLAETDAEAGRLIRARGAVSDTLPFGS